MAVGAIRPPELTLMAICSNCLAVLGRAIAVLVLMNNGACKLKGAGQGPRADRRLDYPS